MSKNELYFAYANIAGEVMIYAIPQITLIR